MIVFLAKDKPNSLELRLANRQEHLKHIEKIKESGIIHFAGPLLDEQENMCGSLIIFASDDLKTIKEIVSHDPYVKAGLFQSIEFLKVKKII